jgi:hypothetical protein
MPGTGLTPAHAAHRHKLEQGAAAGELAQSEGLSHGVAAACGVAQGSTIKVVHETEALVRRRGISLNRVRVVCQAVVVKYGDCKAMCVGVFARASWCLCVPW